MRCFDVSTWIFSLFMGAGIIFLIKKIRDFGELETPTYEYDNYDFRHRYDEEG